jgi:tetratricopeptide (TPR) repeat protein
MRAGRLHPVAAVALACSAPAPPPDLARAETHERSGRDEQALASYEAAVLSCGRERDPERRRKWCVAAMLGRAAALERLGRRPQAVEAYLVIPTAGLQAPEAEAQALVSAARLRFEQGDERGAYALTWRVLGEYPDTSYADEALRRVVRDGRARDPKELARVLWGLYRRLGQTAVGDNLLAVLAELGERELARPDEAQRSWDLLVEAHPKSPLWDDAVWHAARLAAAAGDFAGAERRWRLLLARRESSFLVGSYNSVWMDDAQLALGVALRDRLDRPRDAAAELERLPQHFPDSVLLDDALYELAVTRVALGENERACRILTDLARRHPDSKYRLERAPALAARAGCR